MWGIATEVQWEYRTISGAFLKAPPPPPCRHPPLSLLKKEIIWQMSFDEKYCQDVAQGDQWIQTLHGTSGKGLFSSMAVLFRCLALVCVCVCNVYVSMCDMFGGQRKIPWKEMNRKKKKSNAILSEDALVHLDEKPLFHNYAIFLPPSPRTSISLTDLPLYKNHNIQFLVQGEHATVILFLNLRAPEKSFPLLSS